MTDAKMFENTSALDMMNLWMKSANTFWEGMTKTWPAVGAHSAKKDSGGSSRGRLEESLSTGIKLWETAARTMTTPQTMESVFKGLQTAPDISMQFMNTSIQGVMELQQRWLERLQKAGDSTEAYNFNELDSEWVNRWTNLYEKEIQQYLHIPQLGLTKLYQEKFNQALDKYTLFQAALAEFLHLLGVPMEKSTRVLQAQLSEMADKGDLSEDSKEYYQLWIKILEGHYMTLFKSGEYTRTLSRAIDTLNQFLQARNSVLEDMLQSFPIATHKEVDALYHDLHLLKRRIRELEQHKQKKALDVTE